MKAQDCIPLEVHAEPASSQHGAVGVATVNCEVDTQPELCPTRLELQVGEIFFLF